MCPYKIIVVSMYNDQSDKRIVGYARFFAQNTDVEEATFLYVCRKKRDIPSKVAKSFPELIDPALSKAKNRIEDLVHSSFEDNQAIRTNVKAEEGVPLDHFLKEIQERDIDLVIVGKK